MSDIAVYRTSVARAMTEAELQANVIGAADNLGYLVFHDHDSRRNAAGLPDLILCRPPRLIFAELKRQGKSPRPVQRVWLDALGSLAGNVEVYVWRPMDWLSGDIETILNGEHHQ